MSKVALVIPVYHANELHADFTNQTLRSIISTENELKVYLIVNYSKPEYWPKVENLQLTLNSEVIENTKGNQVGSAWNLGIKRAIDDGYEYILVPNNDIIFHPKAIDNLIKFAKEHLEFILWTASEWASFRTVKTIPDAELGITFDEHPHFSCFMVSKKTIETVGWFDENLKMAYHEDGDYHYRIILSGNKASKTCTSRFYHYGSRTIKVDEELASQNVRTYEYNRDYIRKKWNTDFHQKAYHPPEEILKEAGIYKKPFNMEDKDWRFW